MNSFILDTDIAKCAKFHCDQHVLKMILESLQMLCTVLNKKGIETPYKSTHVKHPCVLWLEKSFDNFEWLASLAVALNYEYRFRFSKPNVHKSDSVLKHIEQHKYHSNGLTSFVQAMPKQYKIINDPITAYRQFYLGEKMLFVRWAKRDIPDWALTSIPL